MGLTHPAAVSDQDRYFTKLFMDDAQSVKVYYHQFEWHDYVYEIQRMAALAVSYSSAEMTPASSCPLRASSLS